MPPFNIDGPLALCEKSEKFDKPIRNKVKKGFVSYR